MKKKDLNFDRSTINTEIDHIAELNYEIRNYCRENPLPSNDSKEYEGAKNQLISRLLRRTGIAAFQGVKRDEGGPFGAMVVDFNTKNGIPDVVGFGTNHVVPNSDPSAHAEITAIRDACKLLGRTDLSGLTLVTSCECCPMCLSAATGCKVDKIYFAATREDAKKVGFSDDDQYRLMTAGGIEKHAQKVKGDAAAEALNGHDAVVITNYNSIPHRYYGDYDKADSLDPTDLPIIQAIKKACKGLAELQSIHNGVEEKVFHLPHNTILISRDMPHLMSLVTADWARIGRVRGRNPFNPEDDSPIKDIKFIAYINDKTETMQIRDKEGNISNVDPDKIWKEIAKPTSIHLSDNLGHSHRIAFEKWSDLINNPDPKKSMPRY